MSLSYTRIVRVFFGLLGLSALITEVIVLLSEGVFKPVNFFSFFTVLSNIFAASLLIYLGFTKKPSQKTEVIRGAVTLYMLMTGVIFAFLLASLEGVRLTATPWDNVVLHYIMPIVVVGDWFLHPPKKRLSARVVALWVVFPIAYVIYTLIRGSIVSWYPYPFFNPNLTSYVQVLATSAIIAVFVIGAAFVIRYHKATACVASRRK